MRTIYEKEALFENLDAAFAELKEYIVSAVNKKELHPVEQQLKKGEIFLAQFDAVMQSRTVRSKR